MKLKKKKKKKKFFFFFFFFFFFWKKKSRVGPEIFGSVREPETQLFFFWPNGIANSEDPDQTLLYKQSDVCPDLSVRKLWIISVKAYNISNNADQ